LHTEGRNLAKLQINGHFTKLHIPAEKWKIDHKNLIHSKSKQLHLNVA